MINYFQIVHFNIGNYILLIIIYCVLIITNFQMIYSFGMKKMTLYAENINHERSMSLEIDQEWSLDRLAGEAVVGMEQKRKK